MFLKDLFSFYKIETTGDIITADIELNPEHSIFQGHFPGRPVLPGVCMMQMVKALIEQGLGRKTKLIQANEVKFLSLVIPAEGKHIQMQLTINVDSHSLITANARLLDETSLLFKFKGTFAVV